MLDVDVIDDPAAATVALDPIRNRLLAELAEPASAASLAGRVGLTRQKVNYHLRALEQHKLVSAAGERQWGGLTERLLVASADVVCRVADALGPIAADPRRTADRLSASYLIALGARVVREVGDLWRRALRSDKALASLAVDTEIRFASPADRAAFTHDLTQAINSLVARYHDPAAAGGRLHRLVLVAYPSPEQKSVSCP